MVRKVAVIMGSDSDWPVVKGACAQLKALDIPFEAHILSAHRTPAEAAAFAKSAKANGFGVILCAAGMAAHLAGAFAANTTLPVIGIPMKGGAMDGLDALLATVQMPSGIPVATVALNGAKNAAWLAAEILALGDEALAAKLEAERTAMAAQIAAKEEKLPESVSGTADAPEIKVGFIAYYAGDKKEEGLTFSSGVLTYHLHETATDIPAAGVLFGITVLWMLGIIVCVMVEIKTRQLVKEAENNARIIKQSMSAFMGFIDAKDSSTNGHSKRVAVYAKKLAQKYGLSKEEVQNIFYMGLMHDCGKIRVPDSILCKKGKLTDEEFGIMKTHTTEGAKLLSGFTSIPQIREAVLYHHERYDGRGYPEGLKGEEIPLVARILCVADSFDAMTSKRCYKKAFPLNVAREKLLQDAGKQFDPDLVYKFVECLDNGTITLVKAEEI